MKKQSIFLTWLVLFFGACSDNRGEKEITLDEYTVVGNIKVSSNDTIFEGPIKYYNAEKHLVSVINFRDNEMNGLYTTYHSNGKISKESNFYYGQENGASKVFDSTGRLILKNYYYYGKELGSTYNYINNSVYYYRFFSFDGWELYSCKYKKDNRDTLLETGGLLNYITNYKQVDDETKIELFLYLVNPPHKKITYKIYDVNSQNSDTNLVSDINVDKLEDQFTMLYLDTLRKGHKYIIQGEAFYPKQNVRIDILKEDEKELRLPTNRN